MGMVSRAVLCPLASRIETRKPRLRAPSGTMNSICEPAASPSGTFGPSTWTQWYDADGSGVPGTDTVS